MELIFYTRGQRSFNYRRFKDRVINKELRITGDLKSRCINKELRIMGDILRGQVNK